MANFFTSLQSIRAEYARGWRRGNAEGDSAEWRRWSALDSVAVWLAEAIAYAVSHDLAVDEDELRLYREVNHRRVRVAPRR